MATKVVSCIVSGIKKRVSISSLEKQSLKFGSVEEAEKHFICREAKKMLRSKITPEQVQEALIPEGTAKFLINYHVLARLKLLKKNKKNKNNLSPVERLKRDQESDNNLKQWYIKQENFINDKKAWIEEMTGGPNKCQVKYGGTCIRPDIYYDNDSACNGCQYYEHCLCHNKRLK